MFSYFQFSLQQKHQGYLNILRIDLDLSKKKERELAVLSSTVVVSTMVVRNSLVSLSGRGLNVYFASSMMSTMGSSSFLKLGSRKRLGGLDCSTIQQKAVRVRQKSATCSFSSGPREDEEPLGP